MKVVNVQLRGEMPSWLVCLCQRCIQSWWHHGSPHSTLRPARGHRSDQMLACYTGGSVEWRLRSPPSSLVPDYASVQEEGTRLGGTTGRSTDAMRCPVTAPESAGSAPPLPVVDGENEFFWTAGADGELRFIRCSECGYWLHPPSPVCPECGSTEVRPQATSGRGTVHMLSVNYYAWFARPTPPYAIAIVQLDEQADLHLTTRLVNCEPESVRIGDRVKVVFEQWGDVWLPLFELDA
jgi:uncharacterized protein